MGEQPGQPETCADWVWEPSVSGDVRDGCEMPPPAQLSDEFSTRRHPELHQTTPTGSAAKPMRLSRWWLYCSLCCSRALLLRVRSWKTSRKCSPYSDRSQEHPTGLPTCKSSLWNAADFEICLGGLPQSCILSTYSMEEAEFYIETPDWLDGFDWSATVWLWDSRDQAACRASFWQVSQENKSQCMELATAVGELPSLKGQIVAWT